MNNENINDNEEQNFNSIEDAVKVLDNEDNDENEIEDENNIDVDENINDENEHEDDEQEQDEQEQNEQEEDDDEIVDLGNGEEIGLAELKDSYQKNKNFTQEVENLETQRKDIENLRKSYGESVDRIKSTYDGLTRMLEGVAFAEPDPQLAHTDPASYRYQMALRNNALAQLQNVYAGRERSESIISQEMKEELIRLKNTETDKLLNVNPNLKDKKNKERFDKDNIKTAIEFGFKEDEINQTIDHRILQLVHYARIGKIAEDNRKYATRRMAETPRKGNRAKNINRKTPRNKKAMQNLDKTGSIHAAMAVEFE